MLLITKQDFEGYIHISERLDDVTKLLPHVRYVQRDILSDMLPDGFLDDIVTNRTTAKYKPVVELIKPFLIWRAMVELVTLAPFNFTQFGIVKKNHHQVSTPISSEEQKLLIADFEKKAQRSASFLFKYLDKHKADFQEFYDPQDCTDRRNSDGFSTIKITAV